jgi:hypothetical protein
MVRLIFLTILLTSVHSIAQEVTKGERKGLIQATGTIYPVKSLNTSNAYYYLNGHTSIYFDNHFSFRGDLWAKKVKQTTDIVSETKIEFSTLYHYNIKRFSTFGGIGTGLGVFRSPTLSSEQFIPSLSLIIGEQFHVNDYFYFFLDAHLFFRKDVNFINWNNEITASGGLGFQFPFWKKKYAKKLS